MPIKFFDKDNSITHTHIYIYIYIKKIEKHVFSNANQGKLLGIHGCAL